MNTPLAASATTTASIPMTPIMKTKSDGTAFGNDFFDCNFNQKIINGRQKHKHWKTFLDDAELSKKIKQFKKENPKSRIMLRDPNTDSYVMANKNWWS